METLKEHAVSSVATPLASLEEAQSLARKIVELSQFLAIRMDASPQYAEWVRAETAAAGG